AACAWSSQKPGAFICSSSSTSLRSSDAGSKVLTDPVELGPELFELLGECLPLVGHGRRLDDQLPHTRRGDSPVSAFSPPFTSTDTLSEATPGCGTTRFTMPSDARETQPCFVRQNGVQRTFTWYFPASGSSATIRVGSR